MATNAITLPEGYTLETPSATQPQVNLPEGYTLEKPGESPSDEESTFLQQNKDYAWVPSDANFPNRPAGIYPIGPGNEWRKNPDYAQAPVDLHLARHTFEGAAEGAMPALLALGLPAAGPIISGAGEYMLHLNNIIKLSKALGWTGFGLKEAHDIYKAVTSRDKK